MAYLFEIEREYEMGRALSVLAVVRKGGDFGRRWIFGDHTFVLRMGGLLELGFVLRFEIAGGFDGILLFEGWC